MKPSTKPEKKPPKKRPHPHVRMIYWMLPLWGLILAVAVGYTIVQYRQFAALRSDLEALHAALAYEEQRTLDLEALRRFRETDAFLAQEARARLGFVKPHEIIFYAE